MLVMVDVTDRKFAVKARLCQSLGVTLAVIRSYLHSPKVLQSLVCVLKLYATDGLCLILHSTYKCSHHWTIIERYHDCYTRVAVDGWPVTHFCCTKCSMFQVYVAL